MRRSGGIALLLLALCAACTHAPVPAVQPFDYMGALRDAEAKLAAAATQADKPPGQSANPMMAPAKSAALQQLGVARSWVGDAAGAQAAFDEAFNARPDDPEWLRLGQVEAGDILAQYPVEDALTAIVREASGRQIVILNEAHHVARHRSFALQVARELRKFGFEYLAMETLQPDTAALKARGYPTASTGHYTREPFFGDYVRQALALGYIPVAYEQGSEVMSKHQGADMLEQMDAREEAQSQNLVDRIFAKDPHARVLIHVGYQHVMKGEMDIAGRKLAWMAERLKRKTGIDPLCIDQANATQRRPATLRALEQRLFDPGTSQEVVLRHAAREHVYWPATDAVDLVVVHRGDGIVNGRPIWTGLHGDRHAVEIPHELLPKRGRRLIQAFIVGESSDAVPVDQVLVTAGQKPPTLMVTDAKIRFAFQD